jgi:hypothetical protein
MHRIVVTDIFGRTDALEEIAGSLSGSVEIFDPYGAKQKEFVSEQSAYDYFSEYVGLESYAQCFHDYLLQVKGPLSLMGFSVGASIIWMNSQAKNERNVSGALCFYGSQIRNFREIIPQFPIKLIFPISEDNFSVPDLIADLTHRNDLQVNQSQYRHGFMNHHSKNFDQGGYSQYLHALRNIPADMCLCAAQDIFAG